jgi:hypothetical protein
MIVLWILDDDDLMDLGSIKKNRNVMGLGHNF